MNEDQKALVKEGVDYYKKLAKNKKKSLPMLPIGFAYEGQKIVSSGLKTGDTLYLALWNLGNDGPIEIPIDSGYSNAVCSYPLSNELPFELKDGKLVVNFTEKCQARFFEIK